MLYRQCSGCKKLLGFAHEVKTGICPLCEQEDREMIELGLKVHEEVEVLRKTSFIDRQFYHELEYNIEREHVDLKLTYDEVMGVLEMKMDMALATKDFAWAESLNSKMQILLKHA